MANEGYDVWLGNNRGNEFSKNHVNLTRKISKLFFLHRLLFDKVDRFLLIKKLTLMKINSIIIDVIIDMLTDTSMKIDNQK